MGSDKRNTEIAWLSCILLEIAGAVKFIMSNFLFQLYARLAATRSMESATSQVAASKWNQYYIYSENYENIICPTRNVDLLLTVAIP